MSVQEQTLSPEIQAFRARIKQLKELHGSTDLKRVNPETLGARELEIFDSWIKGKVTDELLHRYVNEGPEEHAIQGPRSLWGQFLRGQGQYIYPNGQERLVPNDDIRTKL